MASGFLEEKCKRGVPMIPKPKSEAWLICALKKQPYRNCSTLEGRSGNDNSPNSLKAELEQLLGAAATRDLLVQIFAEGAIRAEKIDMFSFKAFAAALEAAMAGNLARDAHE
jgi:hypothetical protein